MTTESQKLGMMAESITSLHRTVQDLSLFIHNHLVKSEISNQMNLLNNVENFSEGDDYENLIDSVDYIGNKFGWSENVKVKEIELKLRGTARKYYRIVKNKPKSVNEMLEWMHSTFRPVISESEVFEKISKCIRCPKETLTSYALRLNILVENLYPENIYNEQKYVLERNRIVLKQFYKGINNSKLARKLRKLEYRNNYTNVEDLLIEAIKIERELERLDYFNEDHFIRNLKGEKTEKTSNTELIRIVKEIVDRKEPVDPNCETNRAGSFLNYERERKRPKRKRGRILGKLKSTPYFQNRCFNCEEEGHKSKTCDKEKVYFCLKCGSKVHSTESCVDVSVEVEKEPLKKFRPSTPYALAGRKEKLNEDNEFEFYDSESDLSSEETESSDNGFDENDSYQ